MICLHCDQEINDNSRFCPKCGKMIPRCPSCGKVITRRMRFCIDDGTRLPEDVLALLPEQPMNGTEPKTAESKAAESKATEQKTAVPQAEDPEAGSREKKNVLVPIIIALIIVLILGIAGTIGYFVVKNGLGSFSDRIGGMTVSDDESGTDDMLVDRSGADAEEEDEDPNVTDEDPDMADEGTAREETLPEEEAKAEETEPAEEIEEIPEEEQALIYFIEHCDKEYFSEKDLEGFDADMCRIARNGIYARLGRKFQDETLQKFFEQFDWYEPVIEAEDFSESMLNDYQVANRDLIVAYEEDQGYR